MANAYDDCGRGRPIILLHGFPFNRSMWREQIEFLSAHGYRVVAPDLRGLGENKSDTQIATMEDMARDVCSLVDELKIDSAIICGLSMGCYIAFEFIRSFPDLVRALVLCGPRAAGADDTERKSREAQALRVLAEGMDFAVEAISKSLLAAATLRGKPDVVASVEKMVLTTDPKGAAAAQRGMAMRRDYSNDLRNIKIPTLIIAGREDGVRTPEDSAFIRRSIKGSQLVVIEDAGHLMNMEQPQVFNEVMLDFLTDNGLD